MQRVWSWYGGTATLTDPTGNVTPVEMEVGAEGPEQVRVRSFGGGKQTTPGLRTPFGRIRSTRPVRGFEVGAAEIRIPDGAEVTLENGTKVKLSVGPTIQVVLHQDGSFLFSSKPPWA